jgi:cysteinyl-tRNA synthetase
VHVVHEGDAAPEGTTVAVAPADPAAPDLSDPDALRLALLERHHHARVRLDPAALDEARATLARWRRAVAAWARQPSRPVPGEVRDRLRAAWEDDVDAPGVLRVLRQVETDPGLPDGARFETYAYADRFLGLHLARDVGAPE